MKGKTAGFIFLAVCVVLAGLMLTSLMLPLAGGIVFAVALAVLGILSRGFGRK